MKLPDGREVDEQLEAFDSVQNDASAPVPVPAGQSVILTTAQYDQLLRNHAGEE